MESLVKVIVFFVTIIGGILASAFVLSSLWEWFIVPTFGLNPLRIVEAIGLTVVVRFLTYKKSDFKTEEEEKDFWVLVVKTLSWIVFLNGFMLILGWIISKFM